MKQQGCDTSGSNMQPTCHPVIQSSNHPDQLTNTTYRATVHWTVDLELKSHPKDVEEQEHGDGHFLSSTEAGFPAVVWRGQHASGVRIMWEWDTTFFFVHGQNTIENEEHPEIYWTYVNIWVSILTMLLYFWLGPQLIPNDCDRQSPVEREVTQPMFSLWLVIQYSQWLLFGLVNPPFYGSTHSKIRIIRVRGLGMYIYIYTYR